MGARVPGRVVLAHRGLPVPRSRAQADVLLVIEDELLLGIFKEEVHHLLFLFVGFEKIVSQHFIVHGGTASARVSSLRQ